ncbi:MAG: phosphatase PAP2 family protein [Actinobacteria bacterium]|nr:phosphatase PAP2 family protein [Actinomycetota bacterium]
MAGSTRQKVRTFVVISVCSVVALILLYVIAVRTSFGQKFDDIAFEGRAVEGTEVTKGLNDLLHSVTRSTLLLLTAALVVFALARRRVRLALAVGSGVTMSVLTTEILKNQVLSRPSLDDVAGIAQNSFPSGHATIAMALSLGMVMVAPHRWRWTAMVAGLALSLTFGIGVLATGWHRPSDVIAAYLVCVAIFALVTAMLLRVSGLGDVRADQLGEIEERLTPLWSALLGLLVVAIAGFTVVSSFTANALHTVDFAPEYVAVCVVILLFGAAVVTGYHELLRGVSLDSSPSPAAQSGAVRDQPVNF